MFKHPEKVCLPLPPSPLDSVQIAILARSWLTYSNTSEGVSTLAPPPRPPSQHTVIAHDTDLNLPFTKTR